MKILRGNLWRIPPKGIRKEILDDLLEESKDEFYLKTCLTHALREASGGIITKVYGEVFGEICGVILRRILEFVSGGIFGEIYTETFESILAEI